MDQFVQKRAWMEALIERRRNTFVRATSLALAGGLALLLSPSWAVTQLLFGWLFLMMACEGLDYMVARDALRHSTRHYLTRRLMTAASISFQCLATSSLVLIFWTAIGNGAQVVGLLLILGAMVQVVSNLSSDRALFYAAFVPYSFVLTVLCVSAVSEVYPAENWRIFAATVLTVAFLIGCCIKAFNTRNEHLLSAIAGRIRLRQERASAEQAHLAKAHVWSENYALELDLE